MLTRELIKAYDYLGGTLEIKLREEDTNGFIWHVKRYMYDTFLTDEETLSGYNVWTKTKERSFDMPVIFPIWVSKECVVNDIDKAVSVVLQRAEQERHSAVMLEGIANDR